MEKQELLDSIDKEILNEIIELPSGINISTKEYLEHSVFPFLPDTETVTLKTNVTIPMKQYIEDGVLIYCIENYNGDFKKYFSDTVKEQTLEEINNEQLIEKIEELDFEDENLMKKIEELDYEKNKTLTEQIEELKFDNIPNNEPKLLVEKKGEASKLKKYSNGSLTIESKYLHTLKRTENFELILELQSLQFSLALFDIALFSNKNNKNPQKVEIENNKVVKDFENVRLRINTDEDKKYLENYLKDIEKIGTVGKFYSSKLLNKLNETKEVIEEKEVESPLISELLIDIKKADQIWQVYTDNLRYTNIDSSDKERMIARYNDLLNTINDYKTKGLIDIAEAEKLTEEINDKINDLSDKNEIIGYGY